MKGAWKTLGGVGLAAALLYWLFRGVDRAALGEAFALASVTGLVAAALLNLAQVVPRTIRWRRLLRPVGDVGVRPAAAAFTLSYMVTWIVPGRLGEVLRPAYLAWRERLPLAPLVGSAIGDRLFDAWTLVVLFAAGVALGGAGASIEGFRGGAWILLAVAATGLTALVAISARRHAWADRVERWPRPAAWIARQILGLSAGVAALRSPAAFVAVAGWSVALWALLALGTWVSILACGVTIAFPQVLVMMPVLAFGAAVPTPGNLGGYQAAMAFSLEAWFDVEPALAVSTGLLTHLTVTVPWIVAGAAWLRVENLRFRELLTLVRSEAPR